MGCEKGSDSMKRFKEENKKNINIGCSTMFCNVMCIIALAAVIAVPSMVLGAASFFPQEKVDKVCLENRKKITAAGNAGRHEVRKIASYEMAEKSKILNRMFFNDGTAFPEGNIPDISARGRDDLYIGPAAETLLIDTNYTQNGDIYIIGNGVLIVDNAQLTLYGHLYGQNKGQTLLRNNAYLYVPQQYLSQYPQVFCDSARFEAINSTVDANTCYRTLLYGSSEYIARHTVFPHWNFRQLFDNSKMIIEDANMVGDQTIDDSCQVFFINCDTVLLWLGVGEGDTVDVQFPDYSLIEHYQFDASTPGVKGIKYSVTIDTCRMAFCGIESWPGSSVNLSNSLFFGTFRIMGSDTLHFNKIRDHQYYVSLDVPFSDRTFTAAYSYVQIWCIYAYDSAVLYMDSCSWGESHAKDASRIYAKNCDAVGFPSTVTSTEQGFFTFTNGQCEAPVSSWNRATTLLINADVIPRPEAYQFTNLGHGHSYLLGVNSYFEYEPEALDTSLVMIAAIDSLSTDMVDTTIAVYGSAWIDVGLFNPIAFDRYKLYWASDGGSVWTLINESTGQVKNDTIAVWNTYGMSAGEYDVRLTVWDDAGDSLTAFADIVLQSQCVEEQTISHPSDFYLYQNQPNPFSEKTRIAYSVGRNTKNVDLKIYDISGRLVRDFLRFTNYDESSTQITWDGKDDNGVAVAAGIYFYQLKVGNKFSPVKKMLLLR